MTSFLFSNSFSIIVLITVISVKVSFILQLYIASTSLRFSTSNLSSFLCISTGCSCIVRIWPKYFLITGNSFCIRKAFSFPANNPITLAKRFIRLFLGTHLCVLLFIFHLILHFCILRLKFLEPKHCIYWKILSHKSSNYKFNRAYFIPIIFTILFFTKSSFFILKSDIKKFAKSSSLNFTFATFRK